MVKSLTQNRKATAAIAEKPRAMRVCADCGFKDTSPIPPPMCPKCHNNPGSPLAPINALTRMSRRQRRAQAAERRRQERKVNRQIALEGGKYEAS